MKHVCASLINEFPKQLIKRMSMEQKENGEKLGKGGGQNITQVTE
jgi:hypothetical protein